MMRFTVVFRFLLICNPFVIFGQNPVTQELAIIPKPRSVQIVGGQYETQKIKTLAVPDKNADALRIGKAFQQLLGLPELAVKKIKGASHAGSGSLHLSLVNRPDKPDYYKLHITKNGILIQASRAQGWFYALQTLSQIVELTALYSPANHLLPYCIIEDEPTFPYRGLHLDVGRHFFPVSFIKNYIDLMARFKYNYFHWHLTEDQGWRIEIKKFPKLTGIGSVRKRSLIGHAADFPQQFDNTEYKGFYTQEEIKEVVRYAAERYIDIIPEIEMPGHSTAALAAYPEFSCSGEAVEVADQWGVFHTGIYCTKDTSLWFVKEILEEVIALFPGPYIHIGGDEVPKKNWKNCSQCQAVKRRNNLKTEEDLQSYFIRNVEKFLSSKGKKLIGWDEILEGGLPQDATVMSWRGTKGGIEAASQKHPVIMCPGTHCYFDHYQSMSPSEPIAIGGYTPLEETYSFDPVPESLKPSERPYIIGAQGNVWTEYMADEKHVLYMAYPRAIALSEVNWTPKSNRDYSQFLARLQHHIPWFKNRGMSIVQSMLDIEYSTTGSKEGVVFVFKKPPVDGKILLESRRDGDDVNEYLKQDSFILNQDIAFKAWYQLENKSLGRPLSIQYKHHAAAGQPVELMEAPAAKYFKGGAQCLVNGISAPSNKFGGPEWVGMEGKDFKAIIDLGSEQQVDSISIQFYHDPGSWIHRPTKILVKCSLDKENYTNGTLVLASDTPTKSIRTGISMDAKTRYLTIEIENPGPIGENFPGAGKPAWLFVGEISVNP